ncbi:NAD(P)H-dependent glycerol-3-phosphate dehydrogenase [Clostridium sp.]|uniref:NAD(P)H-dependent glycerol-3-phosphate dehydrogenase n=1 Tax=Clostridium sp. TaxID=1506 RepID=UPI002915BDA8|nr:NAD(P)H-dependent glycerol-3-phosphate dehydrogenase [Clostridium sp.]MDU4144587.1 NAD(P)H-dependent glycerol-3-phosphate dehydrogenase [Clostridium sp.]
MSKVGFIGGGSFGTALGILLANKGNEVSIYDKDQSVVDDININRKNDRYIKDLDIPSNLTAYNNLDDAIEGIEEGTDIRLSEVINEELPNKVVVLSGPSHAEEVALQIPTTLVVTSKDMECAKEIQDLFMTSYFRVYTNDDIVGVEIGGAVKNIIALAAGVIDGIGYGDNTKAALMTRGMKEISRIGVALGGKEDTFYGLTGMGDLIVTCTSMHSRNRRAGILIGKGETLDSALKEVGMVVEGVKACKAFYELKEKMNISMPITDSLYKVLFQGKSAEEGVKELMERDKKNERY